MEKSLDNLAKLWGGFSAQRRMAVVFATVAMFAAVLFLAKIAGSRNMTLLFGGLDPAAAGDVLSELDQMGIVYEVRSGSIFVDSAKRDQLRLSLASQGLPNAGTQGYELLDGLSGFGTTSQMFDAAYWRAKEGELARTLLANPAISSARVHISVASSRPFQDTAPAAASVTLSTGGSALSRQQIKAYQYLIGSAVPGLSPSDVAVIDDKSGLLSEDDAARQSVDADERAATLRARAERLLSARVGAGNAVVELSLDTVDQAESIFERSVDPDSRIAISTDVTETTGTSSDTGGSDVTVASNLPDGQANSDQSSQSENSETRALTNYEISQTERQVTIGPGAIKRLTIAVLVNDLVETDASGEIVRSPRTDEELQALEQLVASAVGFDEARGDIMTFRSLPFQKLASESGVGTLASSAGTAIDPIQIAQLLVAAVVALILGLFVVRPILTKQASADVLPALETNNSANSTTTQISGPTAQPLDGLLQDQRKDAVERLREMIADREAETSQILQDWIENDRQDEVA